MALPQASKLRCDIVMSIEGVRFLEQDWRSLWAADRSATVFQSFDWIVTWIDHYIDTAVRLLVVACFDGNELVGLAPFYVRPTEFRSRTPRTIMFIGTGEPEADESFAEYMAPLYREGWRGCCDVEFASVICEQLDVAMVDFQRARPDDVRPLINAVAQVWRSTPTEEAAGQCYSMPANREAALQRLSAKQRSNLRRKLRRLVELKDFRLEFAEDESSRQIIFDSLVALHQQRWEPRCVSGAFASARFRAFHESLSARLLQSGRLLLARLSAGGQSLAASYGFIEDEVCHYYQGGLDSQSYPELSPGLLLHFFLTEYAESRGVERYDLMLSPRPDYKRHIAEPYENLFNLRVQRRTFDLLMSSWRVALSTFVSVRSRRSYA